MVRRSSCELSKAAFIPPYCALVWPCLEYAMERADMNKLERAQRLATRPVRGLFHVPYEERLRQINLFSLECRPLRADLILAFKIFIGEADLNTSEFFLRPPRAGVRGHTYRLLKPSSTQERCLLSSGRKILEQTAGTSRVVALSSYLQKAVGPSMVRNLSCSTCVNSVPTY